MVLGCGLKIPDIARIPTDMTTLDTFCNSFRVANRPTGGVDNPNALLRATERVLVEEITRAFVQGAVHSNDIALEEIYES